VVALEQQLAAARDAEQVLSQNLAAVRRAVEQHNKTLLDLAAAETAAQDARAAVLVQEQALAHERLLLNRSLGVPPDAAMPVRVGAPLPSRLDPPAADQIVSGLEDRRLDLVALRKGYESQDQTLRAAVLAQFPKISLGFSAARDTSRVNTLNLGVTMDLPIFDRNQAVIANERATRQKLFDEYVSRVFAARADVAMSLQDIRSANDQIAAAEAAIPGLESLVRAYETALGQGNADVLSYYTARGSLAQKRIDLVKLKQSLIENWIALEIAAGQYLPTSTPTTESAAAPSLSPSPGTPGEGGVRALSE
jgi:cobalt-zinc-cadmium efflux system outer membrane protein